MICRDCESVYFQGLWRHKLTQAPNSEIGKKYNFTFCPACQAIKEGKHKGELIVENIPAQKIERLRGMILDFGNKSFQKDPMDRIISLEDIAKGMIRVLTTKNQMIEELTGKLKKIHKLKFRIIYSQENILKIRLIFIGGL